MYNEMIYHSSKTCAGSPLHIFIQGVDVPLVCNATQVTKPHQRQPINIEFATHSELFE